MVSTKTPLQNYCQYFSAALLPGLFFVLISLKLDHITDTSWHVVFTPLYLLNLYFLFITGMLIEEFLLREFNKHAKHYKMALWFSPCDNLLDTLVCV